MATLEQIKKAKMMARNPEGYTKDRIGEIEANFIAKMEAIANEIVTSANAIKEASSVLFAGDNRPVAEISRETAMKEMEYFKGIVDFKLNETVAMLTSKIDSTVVSVNDERDKLLSYVETALQNSLANIQAEAQKIIDDTKNSIELMKAELVVEEEDDSEEQEMPSLDEITAYVLSQIQLPETSETPEEVTIKVNESGVQIPVEKISGVVTLIDEALKPIKEEIRKIARQKGGGVGGGGMGEWTHESFAADGVLTQFTLSSKVAASGKAAIVRYQGQVQDDTTHYTISDKTLSLTFTPANGTTISIAYVRT